MTKPTDFAMHISSFLTAYLPGQRNVSQNTVKAYRDTFKLLLRFCRDMRGIAPERLQLNAVTSELVVDFLCYIQKERQCSIRTCNLRLAALHSFFRYLQAEEPQSLLQFQKILAIPMQRHSSHVVEYLSAEDLSVILNQPDLNSRDGRRDATLLSLLYDTGARVQELIDISVRDVRLDTPAQVRITGKGRKTRIVPLMKGTLDLLADYLSEQRLVNLQQIDQPLFQNHLGQRLSRSGVKYILEKYVQMARHIRHNIPKVTPHTLRHTKAMHLLQVGNPLVIIRDVLGHADIKSTEIYVKADLEMKRRALEKVPSCSPSPQGTSWKDDTGVLGWLESL